MLVIIRSPLVKYFGTLSLKAPSLKTLRPVTNHTNQLVCNGKTVQF
jgi:hypothetical protein